MRDLIISKIAEGWIDGYDEFYALYQEDGNNNPYQEYSQIQDAVYDLPKTGRVQYHKRIESILRDVSDEILLELFDSQCCQKYR